MAPGHLFFQVKFYGNTTMPTYLHVVFGCFCTTERTKPKIVTFCRFKKTLPTP